MTKHFHTIFNLLALSVILYIGVDAFYKVIQTQLRQGRSRAIIVQTTPTLKRTARIPLRGYQSIMDRNIFGSDIEAKEKAAAPEIETLMPTTLNVSLLGTVTGDEKNAFAVIEETNKKKQGLYRIGDNVQEAVLKMIVRGKVVLRVGDRDEVLEMKEPTSSKSRVASKRTRERKKRIPEASERTITVNRSDVDESLADINKLLTQARIRPHFQDGQPNGLTITGIKAGSIFRKMGLRNGDIIYGINGNPIQSPDDVLGVYDSMTSGGNISVQIKRRGRETTLNYQFEE